MSGSNAGTLYGKGTGVRSRRFQHCLQSQNLMFAYYLYLFVDHFFKQSDNHNNAISSKMACDLMFACIARARICGLSVRTLLQDA
jgi:hypothetical protein